MMTKERMRLIAVEAKRLAGVTANGMFKVNDGPGLHGLYLQVAGPRARSWVYRYTRAGKARDLGLGSAFLIPLADAAAAADEARILHAKGGDPVEERKAARLAARLARMGGVTFRQVAEEYVGQHAPSWRNPKHRQQWESTLSTYCYPKIGSLPVQSIDTAMVLDIVRPIWLTKTETASRVRGRIEAIIDYATPQYRDGDNPARWQILKSKLPKREKIAKVEHHAALPYADIPAFMTDLRTRDSISAKALEITILCCLRTSEVLGAEWTEIDLDAGLWTIPPTRMKAGKEHRIPLSKRALEILRDLASRREGNLVFPGQRVGKPLSDAAMSKVLDLMNRSDLTVHGFRSTFKDWSSEMTNFANEISEAALAHAIDSKVEAAYRRGDLFEKRKRLMAAWGDYCGSQPAQASQAVVVPLRGVS
jgi:integrase